MNAHQRRKLRRAMLPVLLASGWTALDWSAVLVERGCRREEARHARVRLLFERRTVRCPGCGGHGKEPWTDPASGETYLFCGGVNGHHPDREAARRKASAERWQAGVDAGQAARVVSGLRGGGMIADVLATRKREQETAANTRRSQVARRLSWYRAGVTIEALRLSLGWPSGVGLGAVLRELAEAGLAHEQGGVWHEGTRRLRPGGAPNPDLRLDPDLGFDPWGTPSTSSMKLVSPEATPVASDITVPEPASGTQAGAAPVDEDLVARSSPDPQVATLGGVETTAGPSGTSTSEELAAAPLRGLLESEASGTLTPTAPAAVQPGGDGHAGEGPAGPDSGPSTPTPTPTTNPEATVPPRDRDRVLALVTAEPGLTTGEIARRLDLGGGPGCPTRGRWPRRSGARATPATWCG